MSQKIITLTILCLGMSLLAIVSHFDYKDEVSQQQHYCDMVARWDEHKHLPPEQRPGWPPYKGKCDG